MSAKRDAKRAKRDRGKPPVPMVQLVKRAEPEPGTRSPIRWKKWTERRPVLVLAINGPWAMVRRPRCAPYVCPTRDLSEA